MKFTKPLLNEYKGQSVSVTIAIDCHGKLLKAIHPTNLRLVNGYVKPLYRFNIRSKFERPSA